MRSSILFIFSCLFVVYANSQVADFKIAFGSCGKQYEKLDIFDTIISHNPNLFIFLGDNIYGDTENMDTLKNKYQQLSRNKSFQNLKNNVPIIATWDDHDYGVNDGGKFYPKKEESKKIFLDFFNENPTSDRWSHNGIYHSYIYPVKGKVVQVILLDTRTFRDDLKRYDGVVDNDPRYFYELDYSPQYNKDSTILGKEQWDWLEQQLNIPADVRVIGSGTQFGIEFNGYESWANFPKEQDRFVQLIKDKKVEHLFFITGDVHYAEISKINFNDIYPIYDITSSGLSSKWHFPTPNQNRIEGPIMDNHFGLLCFDFIGGVVKTEIWDINNNQRVEYSIKLSELTFK